MAGAVLFLIYLWVTVLLNSCNNKPDDSQVQDEIELLDDEMEAGDYVDDEFEGEGSFDDSENSDYADNPSDEKYEEEEDEYEEDDD